MAAPLRREIRRICTGRLPDVIGPLNDDVRRIRIDRMQKHARLDEIVSVYETELSLLPFVIAATVASGFTGEIIAVSVIMLARSPFSTITELSDDASTTRRETLRQRKAARAFPARSIPPIRINHP